MNKKQKIKLIVIITLIIGAIIFFVLSIVGPKTTTEITKVENVIIQNNMLNKLINEPGIDCWNISSYKDDTYFYLTIEFISTKDVEVQLQRTFNSSGELNKNIDLILEEARSLK